MLGFIKMKRLDLFVLTAVFLGLTSTANLLTFGLFGSEAFGVGVFLFLSLLVLSVFLYGTVVGQLSAWVLFSTTLLSGVLLWKDLFPSNKEILVLLLLLGSVGVILTVCSSGCRNHKHKKCCYSQPPMPLPEQREQKKAPQFLRQKAKETKEAFQPLAVIEPLDKDEEFLELDDVKRLVQNNVSPSRAPKMKKRGRKKRSK